VNSRVPARLSVVTVTYESRHAVATALPALLAALGPGDELIVVDNASSDGTAAAVRELAPSARLIETGRNAGFAAGCNIGARAATGDLLVFVNPDAVVAPGFAEAIRRPLERGDGWSAWMGLVTCEHGQTINTSGGVLHFTGLAWAGQAGSALAATATAAHEVGFVSGACLAIPRAEWVALGGFPEDYFMYHEDVDLSLRLRLRGGRVGIEPGARVDHDYAFDKGAAKWRMLERNRWATLLRCYPTALLVALAPALLATELALVAAALAGGWGRQKLLADLDVVRALPRLLRERGAIQAARTISAGQFARGLVPELSSEHLGRAGRTRLLGVLLRGYWGAVRLLLRA
jgi:GT2 family glycosyltransferase